jgi:hypothetical protein
VRRPAERPQEIKDMSDASEPRVVGRVPFVDGATRDVYEGPHGRQWVTGYASERVYGLWLLPPDEPVVVEGPPRRPPGQGGTRR